MSFSAGHVRGRVAVGARQSRHSLYPPEPWGDAGWTQGAKLLCKVFGRCPVRRQQLGEVRLAFHRPDDLGG